MGDRGLVAGWLDIQHQYARLWLAVGPAEAPTRVAAVRAALRIHDLSTCTAMASAARAARSPQEARDAVLALADKLMSDLV